MEGSVLCHPFKRNGTGIAQLQGVYQNYQASHTLHNNSEGQHQAEEPWHVAQPDYGII